MDRTFHGTSKSSAFCADSSERNFSLSLSINSFGTMSCYSGTGSSGWWGYKSMSTPGKSALIPGYAAVTTFLSRLKSGSSSTFSKDDLILIQKCQAIHITFLFSNLVNYIDKIDFGSSVKACHVIFFSKVRKKNLYDPWIFPLGPIAMYGCIQGTIEFVKGGSS